MKKDCFVIMPFSKSSEEHDEKYWTDHFEKFIKPIIEENHLLVAKRSEFLREDIIRGIIHNLYSSPIVVAELTDYNPNVYWELGVRQSFKNGTITIAEKGTNLPFNISTKGTLSYSEDKFKDKIFKNSLCKALDDCLMNPSNPDSIVLETLGGRGSLFQTFLREEIIRRLDGVIQDCVWNETVINMSFETALKYEQKKLKRRVEITEPLARLFGVELLLTNRYVDANEELYNTVSSYWMIINSINKKLGFWRSNPSETAKALIEIIPPNKMFFNNFKMQIEEIRNDLKSNR